MRPSSAENVCEARNFPVDQTRPLEHSLWSDKMESHTLLCLCEVPLDSGVCASFVFSDVCEARNLPLDQTRKQKRLTGVCEKKAP